MWLHLAQQRSEPQKRPQPGTPGRGLRDTDFRPPKTLQGRGSSLGLHMGIARKTRIMSSRPWPAPVQSGLLSLHPPDRTCPHPSARLGRSSSVAQDWLAGSPLGMSAKEAAATAPC